MQENKIYFSELDKSLSRLSLNRLKQFSAVPKSLYSDLEWDRDFLWDLNIPKRIKNDPVLLICNLVIIARGNPFWKSLFIDFCANQCKKYNYQGKWKLLHKLAKLQFRTLIEYRICEEIPPNEFFGNYLPIIEKESQFFQIFFGRKQKPKPIKIQRKRGYNDKGSAKMNHEIHDLSSVSGPNKEKRDFTTQYKKRSAIINFLYG